MNSIVGIDFSSRPTPRKPITVAHGRLEGDALRIDSIAAHATLESFAAWLAAPGTWVGGFDVPFGLPRELVESLGWPTQWLPLMRHYTALSRAELRDIFVAFCAARPVGAKFAHRATDRPAQSSPSMKWVNPPVAWMLHAAMPLLIDAGVYLPGLHDGDRSRVALEIYPALLARAVIGRRSYKSDERAKHTPERSQARRELVDALECGAAPRVPRLRVRPALRDTLVADASGDRLDAVLAALQAAWGATRPNFGLPDDIDPLEGWIVGAPTDARAIEGVDRMRSGVGAGGRKFTRGDMNER